MTQHYTTWKDTLRLLRIPFSFFLMPVFLLAISQIHTLATTKAWWAFFIIHLLVYPSSNGYNSYVDKDETPIGGLEHPPKPTQSLLYLTVIMDIAALILAWLTISMTFAACLLCYILASRAYSSPQIRLKKYPYYGFAVVVLFQGAFTYYMTCVAADVADFQWNNSNIFVLLATSLQIAGAYPLTQIYQHEADLKDGVVTISYRLGYLGTFIFTAVMFLFCNICYFIYFKNTQQITSFYILQGCFLPSLLYFSYWFLQVKQDTSNANFKNTMRMNAISSIGMSLFSLFLLLKNL